MSTCGTEAGYRAHGRRGEDACPDCRTAMRERAARRRATVGTPEATKARQKARGRALERLADLHTTEFYALWAAERANLGLED